MTRTHQLEHILEDLMELRESFEKQISDYLLEKMSEDEEEKYLMDINFLNSKITEYNRKLKKEQNGRQ